VCGLIEDGPGVARGGGSNLHPVTGRLALRRSKSAFYNNKNNSIREIYKHSISHGLPCTGISKPEEKKLTVVDPHLHLGADSLLQGITCKGMEEINRTHDTNAFVFFES